MLAEASRLLYHYTSLDRVAAIQREGLTLGVLPVWTSDGWRGVRGYQWLTDDAGWRHGWATDISGCCGDRTAVRVQVLMPATARDLFRWNVFALVVLGWSRAELDRFNQAGHSDGKGWWIHRGVIPAGWLGEWEYRPEEASGE